MTANVTEPKRGRGRPKKVTIAPENKPEEEVTFTSFAELRDYLEKEGVQLDDEEKNPDCEVATKGFVKCIARTVVAQTELSGAILNMGCVWGVVAAMAFIVSASFFPGLAGLCLLVGALGGVYHMILSFIVFKPVSGIAAIQKYEPPCEKKRGDCE